MKLTRLYILVIITIILSIQMGCCKYFSMAYDAIFRVAGFAPSNSECKLHLLVDGKEAYAPEPVKDTFEKTYYLSFCTQSYTVEARCNGKTTFKEVIIFPSSNISQPYHLGNISEQ